MKKPKGKTPSLLTQSTGRPVVHECQRQTSCNRCKKIIITREKCFKIPKLVSGFSSPKIYCIKCFSLIIEQTKSELLELEKILNEHIEES
ncbi:MAG: hypothetical protein KAS32_08710 [Candidatus Peribacteraceae bacterium]|nr:hypothetical protein [Candidatus Peribacteraceae bacterium]